ncbi:MAG: serine/threonine-protein kinase [Planctomycetota bacterium]
MPEISNEQAAELISRSLSGDLSREEAESLEQYMTEQDPAQIEIANSFANLSDLIDRSAVWSREQTQPQLSEVSKERMRLSLRKAKADSHAGSISSTRMVAESSEEYQTLDFVAESNYRDERTEENRQAVSRFTLLKKIGEGGLGTVWLARDELLHRKVAIKELNAEASRSKRQWERFRREAEITGHLEHPNVVPLYMSGVNPHTGRPFYVMRFLGKRTLLEAIDEYHARTKAGVAEPLDLHRLLNSFLKVCQAIGYAHARGVIHRDLKPDNVILDNFGQVVVLDWGLAKMEEDGDLENKLSLNGEADDASLSHTLEGDIVGTPLYMAPEQAAGDLQKVDARTDIYGLGAILFTILAGKAPHQRSSVSNEGKLKVSDFINSIVSSPTPSPKELNTTVSKDLEAICMRAMAKERLARYQDVNQLAAEVERWIAGKKEKETRYDALRLAGRDLKSRLCVQIRQLAASAMFVVELPPIQGIVDSTREEGEDFSVWRDRLNQILLALVRNKPTLSGTSFVKMDKERAVELSRIERSLLDVTNIRNVPQSRLLNTVGNVFQLGVLEQFPGECAVSFECKSSGDVRVLCGVPVFDSKTEEPFGLVVAESEIGSLVRPEMQLSESDGSLFLMDSSENVLFTSSKDPEVKSKVGKELFANWSQITQALRDQSEFIDGDQEVYATRLQLPTTKESLYIVLQLPRLGDR